MFKKIACNTKCDSCINATTCISCVGSQNANNSRLVNESCICLAYKYYDALPAQQECQPCLYNTCLTCTNSTSC
jgi:hypothetical protein